MQQFFALAGNHSQLNPTVFGLFIGGIAAGIVINFIYLASFREFSKYLKENHSDAAALFNQKLGEGMTNPSSQNFKWIFKYFWGQEYKSIKDEKLNKYGSRTRFLLLSGTAIFALLFVLFVSIFISNLIS